MLGTSITVTGPHFVRLLLHEYQTQASRAQAKAKAAGKPSERGVVYLGHIPYGFFEDQMKGFFSQFGTITRLRLARSKRTGNSKHYAFIEFETAEVRVLG